MHRSGGLRLNNASKRLAYTLNGEFTWIVPHNVTDALTHGYRIRCMCAAVKYPHITLIVIWVWLWLRCVVSVIRGSVQYRMFLILLVNLWILFVAWLMICLWTCAYSIDVLSSCKIWCGSMLDTWCWMLCPDMLVNMNCFYYGLSFIVVVVVDIYF